MKQICFALLFAISLCGYSAAQKTKPKVVKKISQTKPDQNTASQKLPKPEAKKDANKTILRDTATLSKFEQEIFAELNLVRSNPSAYSKLVEDYLNSFDGEAFKDASGVRLSTNEGKKPVLDVIEILKQTKALPEFKLSEGMSKAAGDHVADLVKNNRTGHIGSDGSAPQRRVEKYGMAPAGVNENISYGTKTARDVVFTMLIDDGTPSRNHRKNILNPQFHFIGFSTGEAKNTGVFCVLVLAGSFLDKH